MQMERLVLVGVHLRSSAAIFLLAVSLSGQWRVTSETPVLQDGIGLSLLSEDGKQLAYYGRAGLMLRTLESGRERQLIPFGQSGWLSSWTADGKFIYYLRQGEKPWIHDLWRVAVDTGSVEAVRKGGPRVVHSRDGSQVAFENSKGLLVSRADGGNERVVAKSWPRRGTVIWSPDASQILVEESVWMTNKSTLTLVDLATGKQRELTHFDRAMLGVAWPSGADALFVCMFRYDETKSQEPGQIWSIKLASGEATQLTHDPTGFSQLIGAAPDGQSLLVTRMNPPAGYWTRLASIFGIDSGPDRIPGTVMLHLSK